MSEEIKNDTGMESDLVPVCGLWLADAAGGKGKFMRGKTQAAVPEGVKLLIFKNRKKTEEKHPDYRLFYAPPEEQVQPAPLGDSDDIPF
jgi:hypothetical protein